jgi:glycosyltransferase involved in cell wall biosynthesis
MRVLSVIHHPVFGGPHNQAVRLAGPLRQRGWETLVLLPAEEGNAEDRLRMAGVAVVTKPLQRLRATANPGLHLCFARELRADVERIRQVIRSERADLVQVNGLVNPHAALAARLERRPVVWQILDTRAPRALRLAMMPVIDRLADVVMCTGAEVARQHPGAGSLGDRLILYVPPVDTSAFRPDSARRASARARLRVPHDARLVGTLGNVNPQKGHEHLVNAAAMLWREFSDLYVRILGASTPTHRPYHDRLALQAARLGLARDDRFSIVDPQEEASRLLPALDVFVLTSVRRSEGIPTVVVEAMACGLPIVTTRVGGVAEVVDDGVTGVIVPAGDDVAIVEAVGRLLRKGGLRQEMGQLKDVRSFQ